MMAACHNRTLTTEVKPPLVPPVRRHAVSSLVRCPLSLPPVRRKRLFLFCDRRYHGGCGPFRFPGASIGFVNAGTTDDLLSVEYM